MVEVVHSVGGGLRTGHDGTRSNAALQESVAATNEMKILTTYLGISISSSPVLAQYLSLPDKVPISFSTQMQKHYAEEQTRTVL